MRKLVGGGDGGLSGNMDVSCDGGFFMLTVLVFVDPLTRWSCCGFI